MTTITIHRALSLLKKAEEAIETKLKSGYFVSTVTGVARRPTDRSFKNETELLKRIQSDTDSVEDNLSLIVSIKQAIAAKNLTTFVLFQGKETSITSLLAIRSTLDLRREYLSRLRAQMNSANILALKADEEISKQISSMDKESVTQLRTQLESLSSVHLVTASNVSVAARIQELEEEIQFLESEIDLVLSETNISTTIEI